MKRIVTLVLCILLCAVMAGCSMLGAVGDPTATVNRFAAAATDKDVEAMLSCCDSSTNEAIDGIVGVSEGLLGALTGEKFDIKQMLSILLPSVYDYSTASGQNLAVAVDATDMQVEYKDDSHATVKGIWSLAGSAYGNTEEIEEPFTLNMVKEDGEWKIDFSDEIYSAVGSAFE